MKEGLDTNIEEMFNKFVDLATEDMTRTIKGAIRKGAKMLKEQTQSNLNSVIEQRGRSAGKFIDTIDDGVRMTRVFEDDTNNDEWIAKVHILGVKTKGSGTFRTKFLELGTKPRFNKTRKGAELAKPRYVGAIRPRYFFRAANQSVLPQLQSIYISEINKSVERINNKKIK